MRFELFIASRYLRAKRRQAVVGVITAISIVGVAAGVAVVDSSHWQSQMGCGATCSVKLLGSTGPGGINARRQRRHLRIGAHSLAELRTSAPRHRGRPRPLWPGVDLPRQRVLASALVKGILPAPGAHRQQHC